MFHKTDLDYPTCLCGSKMIFVGDNELGDGSWCREFRCVSSFRHCCQQNITKRKIRFAYQTHLELMDAYGEYYCPPDVPYPETAVLNEWIPIEKG